jgi:hypothetical protein
VWKFGRRYNIFLLLRAGFPACAYHAQNNLHPVSKLCRCLRWCWAVRLDEEIEIKLVRSNFFFFRLDFLELALATMFRPRLTTPTTRHLFALRDVFICLRCAATAATTSIRGNTAQAQAEAIEQQPSQRILRVVERKVAYRHKLEQEARLLASRGKKSLIFLFSIVCRPRTPGWTKPP